MSGILDNNKDFGLSEGREMKIRFWINYIMDEKRTEGVVDVNINDDEEYIKLIEEPDSEQRLNIVKDMIAEAGYKRWLDKADILEVEYNMIKSSSERRKLYGKGEKNENNR